MTSLRTLARQVGLRRGLKHVAGSLGFDLITRNYYSPVPDLRAIGPEVFRREDPLAGIDFDVDAQLAFVERELGAALAEISLPSAADAGPGRFHLGNGTYEGVDAEMLYAMIRRFRPRRMLELGSGASTLLMAQARERNRLDGVDARQIAYDPFPRAELEPALRRAADLRAVSATDLPSEEVSALQADDVLFVDTTHTVRLAGDVNRIVLDVLPRLRPGVVVHFHDIFLPWEYPIEFFTTLDVVWAEQYLLQAFLAFNPTYEVLAANHALFRRHRAAMSRACPGAPDPVGPSALWLRRTTVAP